MVKPGQPCQNQVVLNMDYAMKSDIFSSRISLALWQLPSCSLADKLIKETDILFYSMAISNLQ